MLMVKVIGVWREHRQIVHGWVWQDKRRKDDQVLVELRSSHDDDKCRRHSSQSSWIASDDSTRDWQVTFETFLLRVYYLNDLDDVGCKTCLFMQLRVQCSIYNHEHDALLRCMITMMVQHEDEGSHARPRWCIYHNAITMMLTKWCIHYDARMMIFAMYARMKCMKYDAYCYHELMMHVTRTLQPFSHS
jgi:hypothetical protein